MLDPDRPVYAPLVLPTDRDAIAACAPLDAAIVSATCAVYARLEPLWATVRERAATLIVDPRTAAFQFEGYMSMEDVRSLPYSPGRQTLGTLWDAGRFSHARRQALASEVLGLQRHLEADVLLAPYFFIPNSGSDWLGVAVDVTAEARKQARDLPLGMHLLVDIDDLLRDEARDAYVAACEETGADFFVVTVVNLEEIKAPPDEVRKVFDLLSRLAQSAPTMLWYAGRIGLGAVAAGAAGYAGGALELESHPRRYLREGLVNLHANAHYLGGAMIRLPVRLAAAVTEACPAAGDAGLAPATRLLQRQRAQAALETKTDEVRWLAEMAGPARAEALATRFDEALRLCEQARDDLAGQREELTRSDYHYLEVLRELAGGAEAEILIDAGF